MKNFYKTPSRLLVLASALMFVIFWGVWFFAYRHYLIWLEGFSYFSTLPDFWSLYRSIPEGLPGYVGSFLHQFYSKPAIGAAVQSFLIVWPVICVGVILIRLFDESEKLIWVSCLPALYVSYVQFWDLLMYKTLLFSFITTALMLVFLLVTALAKKKWGLPVFLKKIYINPILMSIIILGSLYFLTFQNPRNKVYEDFTRLEYWAENREWDKILREVSPADAKSNELKRSYVLLALAETDKLPDYAFTYGLSGSEDFVFHDRIEPLCLNFNALFYDCMDMHNAVIQQAYQLGVQSVAGVSFSSLRRLADTYLELGDYSLAKKYIDILSHSTCHKSWVKERLTRLESIRNETPSYHHDKFKATISNFTHMISSMVDNNMGNKKYADLLLCSVLADTDGDVFRKLFSYIAPVLYQDVQPLPRLYEEALLLISTMDPSVLSIYHISEQTQKDFADYVKLMNTGKGNQAKRKYANTYWIYSY